MKNKRFINDSKAIVSLNKLQIKMIDIINKKISSGIYKFESIKCCICNNNNFEILSEKDRYGLFYPVAICKECGLIQTNPRMNQKAYNSFYTLEYRKLYEGSRIAKDDFFQGQINKGKRIYNFILQNAGLSTLKDLFVLEIGCGSGGILKYFKDRGCIVKGCDLGKEYLCYGKKRYDLDLILGNIHKIKLKKKPDIIIYSHVIEHILDLEKELKKIYEILDDNGLLYIEVPGVKNIRKKYYADLLRLFQNAHVYHFTLTSLENILKKHKFILTSGNEIIQSIFKKTKKTDLNYINDYNKVLNYISLTETFRLLFFTLQLMKKNIRIFIGFILTLFGLKEFIKRIITKS